MKYLAIPAMLLSLSACDQGIKEYSISITNMTNAQPLSPPAALLHSSSYSAWAIGESASVEIERLAEGGDSSSLLAMKHGHPVFSSDAPLLPGESISFSLMTRNKSLTHLTLAGMLVNTNDAFAGVNAMELVGMTAGHTRVVYSYALDAGTELNSEHAGTIPGPADGGEGFNAVRDDVISVVTSHGGVVSHDDGYTGSVLTEAHRFIGPVLRVEITAM